MRNAPLFRERPTVLKIVTGLVVPAAFGAVTGLVLGVSSAGYWVLSLVALAGGVLAGFEHPNGWEGADRGLVGGTVFGTFLLLAHALAGTHAKVALPGFEPILVVFTAIVGMFAGALGGRLRRGGAAEQPPESASTQP
jgi:peptidoglycan/LPS O-acetylase OafA/YrhL